MLKGNQNEIMQLKLLLLQLLYLLMPPVQNATRLSTNCKFKKGVLVTGHENNKAPKLTI